MRLPKRMGLAVVLGVSLTACGTTVSLDAQRSSINSGAQDQNGLGTLPVEMSNQPTVADTDNGASSDGHGAGPRSGTTTEPLSNSTPTASAGAPPADTSPSTSGAKSSSPVTVAVMYLNGGNGFLSAAFPGSSVAFGDGKREAQAVIDDVNAHGGAGGHKIVAKYVPVGVNDTGNAGLQSACQGAIQDYKPMAIFAMFNLAEGLNDCAKKYGVLLLNVALGAGDEQLYTEAEDVVFSPSQITRDVEQKLVLGLARDAGKLPAGKPVGILTQGDDALYDRVAVRTIEPLLKSLGVPYTKVNTSTGTDTGAINGAVLKFKAAGAQTVIFSVGNGGIPEVLFMQAAGQQNYHPAYLMGDSTDTAFVANQAPNAQAEKIWGAGTYPLANVPPSAQPASAAEKRCLAVLNSKIGGYSNRGTSLTGTLYCEMAYVFAHVAGRVSGDLTTGSWAAAYHSAGATYSPVTTFSTDFKPGRQDGASSYRLLGYSAQCKCVIYTSPVRSVPTL